MSRTVTGKVALVTGGSSGIGLAAAKRLVDEGAYVYISGRRVDELDKAVADIGHDVRAVPSDISDLDSLDDLYATIQRDSGRLDILVASASVFEGMPAAEVDTEHYDRVFDINARGTFFTVQKALPLFDQGGSIVLLSSAPTVKGVPGFGIYAASKVAIRSFGRTWAVELKDRGIRVNVVSPGTTDTPMVAASPARPSSRLSRWAGSGGRTRSPVPFTSWLRTRAATRPGSSSSPTAVSRNYDGCLDVDRRLVADDVRARVG